MRKLKFYCQNCEWETILTEDDLDGNERCSMCGHSLILDDDSLDDLVADDLERSELDDMINNFEKYGNDEMWYKIERAIDNPHFRAKLRKQFFQCGGTVPIGDIRI